METVVRGCNVMMHMLNMGLEASPETTTRLMDYVRAELERKGNHKAFVYLSLWSVLSFFINPIGASVPAWGAIATVRGPCPGTTIIHYFTSP